MFRGVEAGILALRVLIALGSCMSLYTPLAQQSLLCQSTYFHALKRVYVGMVGCSDTTTCNLSVTYIFVRSFNIASPVVSIYAFLCPETVLKSEVKPMPYQSTHFHAMKRVYVGMVECSATCLQHFGHVHHCTLLQYCFACCVYLHFSLPRNSIVY